MVAHGVKMLIGPRLVAIMSLVHGAGVDSSGGPMVAREGARPRPHCAATAAVLVKRWRGTGEWRRLAPYPVPRDASPTDSIGVWLERWHLPDGNTEMRRVSADETVVATLSEGCLTRLASRRRTFDAAAMAHAFTDDRLRELLRNERRGMIYVWSPSMPLSVRGLNEAREAARALGIAFTAIVADDRPEALDRQDVASADRQTLDAVELVYRNATIHYPSALFYRDGALLGSAIPGYKRPGTYEALARERFVSASRGAGADLATLATPRMPPAFWVDRGADVAMVSTIRTPRPIGFFFKPAGTTGLIAYTSGDASYLFDLRTRREQRIPGEVDPVPTPDGRFLTRPGLLFHYLPALRSGDTVPMFADAELPDEYQTTSVLRTVDEGVRYRVITGWKMNIRLREYDVPFTRDGRPSRVRAAGERLVPCPRRQVSLPISAKEGREIGVYDVQSETSRIIEVAADGRCTDVLDLGFPAGKLAFSYDGAAVAFATSRINVDAEGRLLKPSETFYTDALVLYRKQGRIVCLSQNRPLRGASFPEFLPDGRVIVLDQASRARPVTVFRIVNVK